jgi:hypothetical protein
MLLSFSRRFLILVGSMLLLEGGAGCKSSSATDGGTCSGKAGGPVGGDKDTHCIDSSGKAVKQATSQSQCHLPAGATAPSDDGGLAEEAPVLSGSEGDDDDCKYHLKWTASCVEENKDVSFDVTVTKKADGSPATKATPELEVYLSDTHPAPNSKQTFKETAPGVYTVGPISFDAAGKWTVRFHLYQGCDDLPSLPESPHGHAAFFVEVP